MKLFCRFVFAINLGVILKDIKRLKSNKLSKLQGVFDLENDLYALWSHSKHHGVFGDLQVSKCLCIFVSVCVRACMFKSVYFFFLCYAPEIETSPVDEPELSSVFFSFFVRLCGWDSILHISLTVVEDALGPAAVCSATGITSRALISSRRGSLCREGAGWCNAVSAAAVRTDQMLYGSERLGNQPM